MCCLNRDRGDHRDSATAHPGRRHSATGCAADRAVHGARGWRIPAARFLPAAAAGRISATAAGRFHPATAGWLSAAAAAGRFLPTTAGRISAATARRVPAAGTAAGLPAAAAARRISATAAAR